MIHESVEITQNKGQREEKHQSGNGSTPKDNIYIN